MTGKNDRPIIVFAILMAAVLIAAQTTPAPPADPSKPAPAFTEVSKLKIVSSYKSAVIANNQAQMAQSAAAQSAKDYERVCAEEVKFDGLPDGTTCRVNLARDEATPIVPPPPPKPDEQQPAERK